MSSADGSADDGSDGRVAASGSRPWIATAGRAAAGPALIIASVLVVLHLFAFGGLVSSQHPDLLAYWTPTYCYLGKSLAAGHIPAWNPYAMGGVPFAADPQSGWMYLPAMALFSALPCSVAIRWMIVLQPILGGLGIYWFLRNEGLSRPASTSGGLVLSLSVAASRIGLFLPLPSAFAWTALMLAGTSHLFTARSWSSRLVWCLLAAVAWGQLDGAHAGQGVVVGTAALTFYVVVKAWASLRSGTWGGGELARALAVLIPALGLVNLAVLLPRAAYIGETSYGPGSATLRQVTSVPAGWPLKFATVPGTYLGAIALALAFGGLWSRRHRSLAVGFGAFGGLSYLASQKVVAERMTSLVRGVPMLNLYQHYPARLTMGVFVALPVMAGLGVEAWREARGGQRIAMIVPGCLVWFVLPLALGAGVSSLVLLVAGGAVGLGTLAVVARRPRLAWAIPAILALELATNGLLGQTGGPFAWGERRAADTFGANTTGWTTSLKRPTVEAAAYLRPGAIALGLQRSGGGPYLSYDTMLASHRGYLVEQAQRDWGFMANQRSMLFDVRDIQGYNPFQLARYSTLIRAGNPGRLDYNAAILRRPTASELDLLGVADVVAPASSPPPPELGATAVVAREGRWGLFRRSRPPPTAQLLTSWRIVSTAGAALRAVTGATFDSSRVAVLETNPGVRPVPGQATGSATVSMESMGQRFIIRASAVSPSILLLRVPYEPGWRVTVDGRSRSVLRADYLLQAVPIPAGVHTVAFVYRDGWIGAGLLGSGISVAGLLAAAAFVRRRVGRNDGSVVGGSGRKVRRASRDLG